MKAGFRLHTLQIYVGVPGTFRERCLNDSHTKLSSTAISKSNYHHFSIHFLQRARNAATA